MIKKSLRAYITDSQLVKFVLPPGKAVGLLFCQFFKQQVHRILAVSYTHLDVYKRQGIACRKSVMCYHQDCGVKAFVNTLDLSLIHI